MMNKARAFFDYIVETTKGKDDEIVIIKTVNDDTISVDAKNIEILNDIANQTNLLKLKDVSINDDDMFIKDMRLNPDTIIYVTFDSNVEEYEDDDDDDDDE